MKARQRRHAFWILIVAALLIGAAVISLLVIAGGNEIALTAEAYADVIRFEAYGAASLQIRIYDMAENVLWDSGQVNMDFVDWDRSNEWGERLANGYYIYFAQAWSNADEIVLSKTGKVVLLPGDQVQLQSAPVVSSTPDGAFPWEADGPVYGPQAYSQVGDFTVSGSLGVGTQYPPFTLSVQKATGAAYIGATSVADGITYFMGTSVVGEAFIGSLTAHDLDFRTGNVSRLHLTHSTGNVGIGTRNPTARLTVEASAGDLIAAYNGTNRVFVVKSTGEVRADGAVYADAFLPGGADVAERINVSEWVEAGDVVEIDPEHPGFFRKATGQYSQRVAGIISTSPGVILGNDIDPETDSWDDNRPVLAIAGRVPCKVSDENGPIQIGDLLVSSSTPGIAMKGDPTLSIGSVVGKAMEPLSEAEGVIMAQVTLR